MAVIAAKAQENVTYEAWEGTINKGKTPVLVFLEERDDGVVAGWIKYPNAKKPSYLFLAGGKFQDEETGDYFSVHEYQKDGHRSGHIFLTKAEEGYKGEWTHLDTEYDMVLDKPISYPEELKNQLAPASHAQIGKEYSFEYDHITGDLRGGTAKFSIKNNNNSKMAYEIGVYAPNIAEGKGIGVLYDNVMTGVEEEANYEFHVEFFPKFCIITNIVGPDPYYYGANTTLANIYIKVK